MNNFLFVLLDENMLFSLQTITDKFHYEGIIIVKTRM